MLAMLATIGWTISVWTLLTGAPTTPSLEGRLLLVSGSNLIEVTVPTGQARRMPISYDSPYSDHIQVLGGLQEQHNGTLLLHSWAGGGTVFLIGKNGRAKYVRSGRFPTPVLDETKLLQFDRVKGKVGSRLVLSSFASPYETEWELPLRAPAIPRAPIKISEDRILVVAESTSSASAEESLWEVDLSRRSWTEKVALDECYVLPIWRSRSKQFLCAETVAEGGPFTGRYFLRDIDGTSCKLIKMEQDLSAVLAYLQEEDAMLFASFRDIDAQGQEVFDLYSYKFSDDTVQLVVADVPPPSGLGVWAPAP